MHSLEMIVFLNSRRMAALAHRAARIFNAGSDGHPKSGEKTGRPLVREDWISEGEWEARKKKRKRRGY